MKKLLVFQHVPHEDLGTLGPLLRDAGIPIEPIEFWREPDAQPTLDNYRGLVVLGGPMGVYDSGRIPHLAAETKLIAQAVTKSMPVLGICLGAQLIAHALGARVYPSGIKEIGWYDLMLTTGAKDDPLFSQLDAIEKVFQWHGDTFDIPTGAVHLGSSQLCENQAFRYAENVYALQFHFEVDATMIENWLRVPENRKEIADLNGLIDPAVIRLATTRHIERLSDLSRRVFGAFVKIFAGDHQR